MAIVVQVTCNACGQTSEGQCADLDLTDRFWAPLLRVWVKLGVIPAGYVQADVERVFADRNTGVNKDRTHCRRCPPTYISPARPEMFAMLSPDVSDEKVRALGAQYPDGGPALAEQFVTFRNAGRTP